MRGMDDFLKLLTRVGLLAGALFFCPVIHSASNQELSKVREQIQQIEAIGLEKYYQGLSKAIADAGDGFITDFSYTWSEK